MENLFDLCIHHLFERQVSKTPDKIALILQERKLTYAEINEQANQIAAALVGLGVGIETPVGICLRRSPEAVAAILGILKAGGAYVPIDPDFPESRKRYILEDSGCGVLLTEDALLSALPPFAGRILLVDVTTQPPHPNPPQIGEGSVTTPPLLWGRLGGGELRGATKWRLLSTLLFGLACASKPTAWFLAPFYGLLLLADQPALATSGWIGLLRAVPAILRRVWPGLLVFALLVGPYVVWDASAFYDDVWRWSSGQGETGYQIWGWGASNFVLILGLVADRFGQWPFWLLEVLVAVPLLLWFVRRQQQNNQPGTALWHYAALLALFFYVSRFLNENYLGYLLAFFALGYLMDEENNR